MNVDFLRVHFLAHRFKHPEAFSQDELTAIALDALQIMDTYQALHPAYAGFQAQLARAGRAEVGKFLDEWAKSVELNAPKSSYLVELDDGASTDKQHAVDEFKQVFAVLIIQCDFRMVQFYLGKLDNIAQFPAQVTSHQAFAENRYYEHLFYQLVALIFGRVWFEEANTPKKENEETFEGPTGPRNIASIEKRNHNYHTRCSFLFKALDEKPEAVRNQVEPEIQYHLLLQWLSALVKFTQGKLQAFIEEFDRLYEHIQVLESLGLVSEVLVMYAVASIATRPFNQLNMNLNEALVDSYTSDLGSLEEGIFEVLTLLSNGEFHAAKSALANPQALQKLFASLGFALPDEKAVFFERLTRLIDQKAFLLILSLTKRILREKLLGLLGYFPRDSATYDEVSNKLLLLISVLNLGESKVVYESASDLFCYKPSLESERHDDLQSSVEELTHDVRAEASASMLKSLLMKKHFDA